MPATVAALSLAVPGAGSARRGIDNATVVSACLDYAESVRRVPAVGELCQAAFVCRRKLWDAFDAISGLSPSRFFRAWGLDQARDRLLAADPGLITVQQVAVELGFGHTGRFARRYADAFGESPSETLRASA